MNRCEKCDCYRPEPGAVTGRCFLNPPTVVAAQGIDPITGLSNAVNSESVRPEVAFDDGCAQWVPIMDDKLLMEPGTELVIHQG